MPQSCRSTTSLALIACLLAGLCGSGCSSATLERAGGPNIEARVVASDNKAVYVTGDDGQIYRVSRSTLRDVDHPGNVLMVIGGVFLVPALTLFIASLGSGSNNLEREMASTYFIMGAPLFLAGIIPYTQSVRAATSFEPDDELERQAATVPLDVTAAADALPPQ